MESNRVYILNTSCLSEDKTHDEFVKGEKKIKTIELGPVRNHAFVIL